MQRSAILLSLLTLLPFSARSAGLLTVGDGVNNTVSNLAGAVASRSVDTVYVGLNGGSGNRLNLSGQAVLNGNLLLVGEGGGYNGIMVSEPGTTLTGRALIGLGGSGNSLVVTNGGTFLGEATVGYYGNENNLLHISGPGSRMTAAGAITVGFRAAHNRFAVSRGATAAVGSMEIGYSDGVRYSVYGNETEVSGPGSELTTGPLKVGGYYASGGRLKITDGAAVASSGAQIVSDFSGNNGVEISGGGARWTVSGPLEMVSNDPLPELADNVVHIGSGGTLAAEGGLSMRSEDGGRSANRLTVDDGGELVIGSDFQMPAEGLILNSGAALTVRGTVSGLSVLEAGRRLETPAVQGDLTVNGVFAPGTSPAECRLDGNFVLTSTGMLEMEIAGLTPGTGYDRLTVTGSALLDGTLNLLNIGNIAITNGLSFDLFNWEGGAAGTFASVRTPPLDAGLSWDTSGLYTSGTLSVIPEPSSALLLLVSSAILCAKKRRLIR